MKTNQTSYVTKLLYWKGSNSFEYSTIFKELVLSCKVFFDIGANTGYYSLLATSINPRIEVHAFEPAQGPHHYLKTNVHLNSLEKQITIHSIALSNTMSEAMFYEVRNKKYTYLNHNLGGVGSLKQDSLKVAYKVKTETLDQFIKKNSILTVDLIKIDTEGTEDIILEGSEETILKFHPIIICETLFGKIENRLEIIMKKHDYLFFNHENGKLREVKTLFRSQDNGVRDCFFVHQEKLNTIERFIA
jgi:FkbM family methyltransferase